MHPGIMNLVLPVYLHTRTTLPVAGQLILDHTIVSCIIHGTSLAGRTHSPAINFFSQEDDDN